MGRIRQACSRFLAVVAGVLLLSLLVCLAFAGAARASDWTEVPFLPGQTAWDVVQDSDGNVWATTLEQSGSWGHVDVLWKGASRWQDACTGLDWNSFQWQYGLVAVKDKLFLAVSTGDCYARSPGAKGWHQVTLPQAFYDPVEWDGYLWAGSGYEGVVRLDPGTELATAMNAGLPLSRDGSGSSTAFWAPRGDGRYLYVGFTVGAQTASTSGFPGVSVYRLAKGGDTWEDTGLNAVPQPGDIDQTAATANAEWGVWGLSVVDGYVLAEVSAASGGQAGRFFLFDEKADIWSPVTTPVGQTGWYLQSGAACITWDGKFYFPDSPTSNGAYFDVFDPSSRSWSVGVSARGTPWAPLGNIAQLLGKELLVSGSSSGSAAGTAGTAGPAQPSFVESVPLPTQISTDPGVIGTNVGLALLFAVIFGFTSTLFNSTLKSNYERIHRAVAPLGRALGQGEASARPLFRRLWNRLVAFALRSSFIRRVATRMPRVGRRWLERLAIVLLAAIIYAFLDPTFGFSHHGVNIYFSLFFSIAIVTAAWEGMQAFTSARGYRVPAAVKLFPAAMFIAVLCVLLSRLSGFTPGYLYGFVGGLAFLGVHPDERRRGRMVLVGATCLLAVSVGTWFLAMPLSTAAESGAWWATFLHSVCAAIFVAGLEGVLFGLVPLDFMDGGLLFRWSKVLWSVMFGVSLFLFWHVLLNKNSKYGAAFEQTNTQVVLALLGFWTVTTVGIYLLFRRSHHKAALVAAGQEAPPPPPYWQPPAS